MAEKEYIDKRELLKHQRKMRGCGLSPEDDYWDYAVLAEDIESAPAADVAPVVHGEWIIKTNYKTPVSHAYIRKEKLYICPYCGKDYRQHMNFCGNCGAKMDGKEATP